MPFLLYHLAGISPQSRCQSLCSKTDFLAITVSLQHRSVSQIIRNCTKVDLVVSDRISHFHILRTWQKPKRCLEMVWDLFSRSLVIQMLYFNSKIFGAPPNSQSSKSNSCAHSRHSFIAVLYLSKPIHPTLCEVVSRR